MNKHVANLPRLKRSVRTLVSSLLVSLLTITGLSVMSSPAQALSVDASAATFNFAFPTNGTLISGTSKTSNNAVVKYSNITGSSIPGVSIDAVVTTTLVSTTISDYDSPGSATTETSYFQVNTGITGTNSYSQFKFDFYEGGTYTGANTGIPIVLRNVSVTSLDLDGQANCQFTDMTSFQSYILSNPTYVSVKTNANDSTVPVGTTRFLATRCANNDANIVNDAVEVRFDSVTSFTAKLGSNVAATTNYFALAFKPLSTLYPTASTTTNSNTANQPPTSTNTTVYSANGLPQILQLSDFGTYADADSNPFSKVKITALPGSGSLEKYVNGVWVPVVLNDEITVADITNGNLRFTGTTSTSLQFKVYDGGLYSTSAYTMTLSMSNQPQTITFANPGTKTPTTPAFASGATASSGLTVTLTSLTPGICTVSGLNIVPVSTGQCTIVATQTGNSSYSEAPAVTQSFPITALTAQTITAPNPGTQTWSGSSYTITRAPTASSGLTVTMISTTPDVCTISGFVITIVGPGNCTIRNTQAGNGTYGPAPQVEYTFAVNPAASSFTITYDGNNNYSGTVPAVTTGSGSVTLRGNTGTLARSGYTLTGWNTAANGSGTHYSLGGSYNLTADVTLYAEWTADASFTITYNTNSSTGGSAPSNTTGSGSVTLAGNTGTLVRTGYTLTGWNTAANGSGTHYALSGSYSLTANVTLYAEWTAIEYTITYDGNSNSSGSAPASTVGYGSIVLTSGHGTLVRTGYTFSGWNTQADGLGTHYASAANYNLLSDVTLYAEWSEVNYTVTYHDNGKTGGTVPANTTGHGSVTLASNSGSMVRTGYTLTGWNTNAGGTGTHYDLADTYTLNADVNLYAEWTVVSFTLTFDGNSATTGLAPVSLTGFGNKSIPGNLGSLVKTNYTFRGWNTAANGSGTRYTAASSYNLTADATLYAEWVLTPQVQYNANGANGGTTPNEIPAGSPVTVDPNTGNLHRSGFRFGGWNTSPNGTGTTYAAGTTPVLPVGTVLYAVWIPESSLAATGSNDGVLMETGASLVGLGLLMNAIVSIRRRRRR